jgi:PAS domain S-box-containing protein
MDHYFFDLQSYSFTLHAFGVFAAGISIFLFGAVMYLHERSRVGLRNWFFSITESAWLVSFGMAYASRTDALALAWFKTGYFGFVFLPAALIALNVSILQRERELRYWVRGCYALSLLFLALHLGTHLFMKGLYHYPWGPYPAYGLVGFLFTCYVAVVGGTSLVLFYRAYQTSTHPRFKARNRGFFIAALIGYPAFLDFLPKFGIAVYPIGYLAVTAYLLYASRIIMRYRLVDVTPEVATRQILETMQGAVIVEDLEGNVRVANRTAQEMLGYEKEELIGMGLAQVLPAAVELRGTIKAGERAASKEMVWTARSGQRTQVSVSASSLTDDRDQEPVGIVYVAHDITKRKQAEERLRNYSQELREANRKLEALDRLKSEFVSTVSHELRTPLTSIKANAELILMKPDLHHDKKHRLLVTINRESDRLTRLINDLLDLSKIEAGTVQWRREEVSVNDIVRFSIDAVLPLLQNKRLQLKTSMEDPLPPVWGDRDRLVQVMNNLLSNAIKFTPSGGSISVAVYQEESQIFVTVQDTGTGIPAEEIDIIFDKFHRSRDQVLKQTEGTGLGLTIVRQIVEYHGGSIRASSTYGAGTTMTVILPVSGKGGKHAVPGQEAGTTALV